MHAQQKCILREYLQSFKTDENDIDSLIVERGTYQIIYYYKL